MTSCSVDEVEPLPIKNKTMVITKESYLKQNDSLSIYNKEDDIIPPTGTTNPPVKP